MTARLRIALAAVAGVVVGAVATLAAPVPRVGSPGSVTPSALGAAPLVTVPVDKPIQGVLLVWTPDSVPPEVATAASAAHGVDGVTVLRAGGVALSRSVDAEGNVVDEPARGMVIPLDALAFDPTTYSAFVPASDRSTFAGLGVDEVLLGESSASVRRLDVGASLMLADGRTVRVAGVVDDTSVGGSEVAFTHEGGAASGLTTDRWLLVRYREGRGPVEDAVRSALPGEVPVRFRGPGETPWLRAGDAVIPQVIVKARFGEFAYRPPEGSVDEFDQDPAWRADNLVDADIPLLGRVRCHRAIVDALAGAMADLEAQGLGHVIAPGGYDGCHNARTTRSGAGLSRHAWGVAVDLNYGENPTGVESEQDPRLLEVMERWGFGWGGLWLVRDPAHFEFVRPPDP